MAALIDAGKATIKYALDCDQVVEPQTKARAGLSFLLACVGCALLRAEADRGEQDEVAS